MKIAIIGGAGVRTPLLVNGLTASDLPITEIALFDTDQDRLGVIASVAGRFCRSARLRCCATSAECLEEADFVFTSIRVGGIARRARDELISLQHGIVGQETVGPGGFAMAMRTIPHMVRYAQEAARLAPRAWIINFTNPVGIITQAVRAETSARIIGICDTPTELFEGAAHTLGLDSAECYFDYFGLNHLGWLREVYYRGDPQLHRLWAHADLFVRIYRAPLFEPEFLATLRLLPTEYLYYYYRPSEAFEHMRASGRTRGQVIAGLNEQLFGALAAPGADVAKTYEKYLATRNDSYMTLEAEAVSGPSDSPWASLTGYDKIALAVVRAIHFNTGAVIPLNVRNQGNLPDLEVDDVIEVPCVVNANGAIAVHVDPVPDSVRDLMVEMKRYERLTMRAALSRSPELTVEALAANPLVRHTDLSRQIIGALAPLW